MRHVEGKATTALRVRLFYALAHAHYPRADFLSAMALLTAKVCGGKDWSIVLIDSHHIRPQGFLRNFLQLWQRP